MKLKKKNFQFFFKKIKNIYKTINNFEKIKFKINIIIKDYSKKQIIISINFVNISKFISLFSKYITNINKVLKNIKFNVFANFVCANYRSLIITTNKITFQSDFNIIEKYIKNINVIKLNNIIVSYLSQFKLYFKIISISYIIKDTNIYINSSVIKTIIKFIYIFNNMYLILKPHIIKTLPKSNIVVI